MNEESSLKDLITKITEGEESVFSIAKSLDGKGKEIRIGKQRLPDVFPEDPPIRRAKPRSHEFHTAKTFAGYLTNNSTALADVDNLEILAVIDENVEQDREIVSYRAKIHPMFAPWHKMLGATTEVRRFALHCMTHRRSVVDPNGRELAMVMSQVKASKTIESWSGVGNGSVNGLRTEIQIGSEKKAEMVEIPDSIVIEAPIFIGTDPQRITIDLTIDFVDGKTVVYCTSTDYEEAKISAFESIVNELTKAEIGTVGFGKIQHRHWETTDN